MVSWENLPLNVKSWLFLSMLCLFIWACQPTPDPLKTELRLAIEKLHEVETRSLLNVDDRELSDVATGSVLESLLRSVEMRKRFSNLEALETKIASGITILEYTQDFAVVETLVVSNHFSQDKRTGERHYYSETSDLVRIVLVKEDEVWKVSETDVVDRPFD